MAATKNDNKRPAQHRTKSMTGSDGRRKLAAGAGRQKQKSGGEPQKQTTRVYARRTGSSRQRKG
jgi:hypothetical protein